MCQQDRIKDYSIRSFIHGQWQCPASLTEATGLFQEKSPVVSVVGAGGKTTTIRRLFEEYVKIHQPVIVTTATHIEHWNWENVLVEESISRLHELLKNHIGVWVGTPTQNRKLCKVSDEFFQILLEEKIPLIIEADGGKRMPCKAPQEHEPVIVKETDCVIAVYGLSAIGKPIGDVCFRKEIVLNILEKSSRDILTENDMIKLALSPLGGKKSVEDHMEYQIIFNQADTKEMQEQAKRMAEAIGACADIRVHITGVNG